MVKISLKKLSLIVLLTAAIYYYFLYLSGPAQKIELQSATVAATPHADTAQVADSSTVSNKAAIFARDCASGAANPLRTGLTSCSAEEVSGAIIPPSATTHETNDLKKIMKNLTNLSNKFDQFQKTPTLNLYPV